MNTLFKAGLVACLLLAAIPSQSFAQWQQGPVNSQGAPVGSRPASTTVLQKVDTLNRRSRANPFNSAPRRAGMSRVDTVRGRR